MTKIIILSKETDKYQFIKDIYKSNNINIVVEIFDDLYNLKNFISNELINLMIVDGDTIENPYSVYSEMISVYQSLNFPILFKIKDITKIPMLIKQGIYESNILLLNTDDGNILSVLFTQTITEKIHHYENLSKKFTLDYFSGSLNEISIIELLYACEKNKKSGVLKISNKSNLYCELFFVDGLITHANGTNNNLELTDQKLIYVTLELVNNRNISYEFLSDITTSDSTINISVSHVINDYMRSKNLTTTKNEKQYSIRDTLVTKKDSISYDAIMQSNKNDNIKKSDETFSIRNTLVTKKDSMNYDAVLRNSQNTEKPNETFSIRDTLVSKKDSINYDAITRESQKTEKPFSISTTQEIKNTHLDYEQSTNNNNNINSNFIRSKNVETLSNFDNAIEIAEDTYWVSHRNPQSLLQLNSYLRVFKGNGRTVNLLVDPGALEYFPVISGKVSKIAGDISKIQMYSVNHQDPDVGMNAVFISRINPKSVCLATEDTWRLIQFYEIPKQSFKDVYTFDNKITNIATDPSHSIEFVPTPYCHFVGAFALYDKKNRALFTGDLFGGLSPANNFSLVATEEHWEGMKIFHQIYMPSSKAIKNAIDNIRKLDPPPLMLVPQHGSILAGEIMEQFMNRLYNLEVGTDLFNREEFDKVIPQYIVLMNTLYNKFVSAVGLETAISVFKFHDKKQELFYLVDIDANGIKGIYSNPERGFTLLLEMISKCKNNMVVNEMKSLAVKEALLMRLPIPANLYTLGSLNDDPTGHDVFSDGVMNNNESNNDLDVFA
jgi:glyoxylase-like metal-dependent hydrolase (beta-lactamase superfamily II)